MEERMIADIYHWLYMYKKNSVKVVDRVKNIVLYEKKLG